jgi:hypothetical protein
MAVQAVLSSISSRRFQSIRLSISRIFRGWDTTGLLLAKNYWSKNFDAGCLFGLTAQPHDVPCPHEKADPQIHKISFDRTCVFVDKNLSNLRALLLCEMT